MVKRLSLIFLLASQVFLSVLSTSILTIENKCNDTIWPAIYSWNSDISTTGFALKKDEARAVRAPSSWYGLISGRTLCSNDSKGNFSCTTGDCESNKIECPGSYSWSPITYIYFRINYNGINSYTISLEYGYNLPVMVTPSKNNSLTCISSGCMVDLNKTCPDDLKTFDTEEGRLIGCSSECKKYGTEESCCTRNFRSNQNCKATMYSRNLERVCPLAYTYAYGDNNSTIICPNSTDYVITFCPSSIPDITRSSMAPKAGARVLADNSLRTLKSILGSLTGLAGMIIIVAIVVIVRTKNVRRKNDSNDENIEAAVMLRRYSYEQVEKMTNSFAHVLGKGGFGTVYKGRLPNASGREIALKILDESKGNGQDFINELASMSRASHVNIVSLFGFCYEGSKRAIIYEFMPNGSLDKFISKNMSEKMDWKMLYNIVVGIARGLEYLHNSCVSKIVHFDIKPQNILMDEDFCPKISDFGLAKLCKNKESVISLLDMRGTVGYIAPEVFSKNFGGVSHKSDVYSFGMVVLEMIGEKNKERVEASIFFPDYIYEDLERKESKVLVGDHIVEHKNEEDEEEKIERKLKIVGLWCIQTNPSDRPPIRKVVEMLNESLDALEVPPKPLMSLPLETAWKTIEDSDQESSSFLKPNKLIKTMKSPPTI